MLDSQDESLTGFVQQSRSDHRHPRFQSSRRAKMVTAMPQSATATNTQRAGKLRVPSEAAAASGRSRNVVCPSQRIVASVAEHVPVYAYEFMDAESPIYFPEVSYPYGAAHTLEIQYLFPRYHGASGEPQPLSEDQEKLSQRW